MVGFDMSTLNLNYDAKYDILYARRSDYSPSYGDECNGVVTYYSIETDCITGMAIYNIKEKMRTGSINGSHLPIPLDLNAVAVQCLLHKPENGYKCTLLLT